MADLRVSMLFEANSASARAAVKDLQAAVQDMDASLGEVSTTATALDGPIDAITASVVAAGEASATWSEFVEAVRRELNPFADEAAGLAEAVRQVTVAEEVGALTAREAALAHDGLARKAIELQARAAAVGMTIDGTTTAVQRQETAIQQLISASTGLTAAAERSIAAELQHGLMLDDLRARFNPLFAAQRRYQLELRDIAEAERLGAISAREAGDARERAARAMTPLAGGIGQIGQASRASTAYVANLSYQLNDIGMMMAMGQSPFMLMVQQGPQVVQVFGQMRAAGIGLGTALRDAFAMLVNPMSIATLAVIGFGAAAVQWLTSSGDAAADADEAISDLGASVRSYRSAVDQALTPMVELRAEWGRQAEAIRELNVAMSNLERLDARRSLDEAQGSFAARLSEMRRYLDELDILDQLPEIATDVDRAWALQGLRDSLGVDEAQARRLAAALDAITQATGPQDLVDALAAARAEFSDIADHVPAITQEMSNLGHALFEGERNARALVGPLAEGAAEARATTPAVEAQAIALSRAAEAAGRTRQAWAERIAFAREEEARLGQIAELNDLIARYGRDSVEVARARHAAERRAYEELLASRGIAGELAEELLAAWDAANRIAWIDMASVFSAAAGEVDALWGKLLGVLGTVQGILSEIGRIGFDTVAIRAETAALEAGQSRAAAQAAGSLAQRRAEMEASGMSGLEVNIAMAGLRAASGERLAATEERDRLLEARQTSRSGGGGRTSAAEKERQAVTDLLAEQRRQIAVLRETDPIQREILANHEALAAAIPAETAELRGLIAERQRLESIRDITDDIGASGKDAFTGLLKGAHSLSDALISVLDKLADIAASTVWDMFWNGTGGNSGLSGIVSSLVGGLLPGGGSSGPTLQNAVARADGGMIHGPGGPRDDQVLMWGSNGEYVINAAATAANRGLVEAINAGASPSELLGVLIGRNMQRLATGGMVGAAPSAPRAFLQAAAPAGAAAFGPPPAPVINIINRSPEPIREERGSGNGPDLEGAVTLVVGKAEARGKFDKTRRARFGQTPEVARR